MSKPTNLLEQGLDEMYREVRRRAAELTVSAARRRRVAYGLKIVAAGGGLFVATGLLPTVHQVIGIAVLVAVFLESVFSNHDRLLAQTEAGYAFDALGNRVKREYAREAHMPIERLKVDKSDAAAQEKLAELMRHAHKQLEDGLTTIKDELHNRNVQALRSLSLEAERTGAKTS